MAIEKITTENEPIPLPNSMRDSVRKLIARHGGTPEQINFIANYIAEEFNVIVSTDELTRIARVDKQAIANIRKEIKQGIEIRNETLAKKMNVLLERTVTRALADAEKYEMYEKAFEEGAIDKTEFKQRTRGLKLMNVNDMIKIANHLKPQSPQKPQGYQPIELPPGGPQLPPAASPEAQALARELGEAVARGDQVEIQRILWQQNPSAQSTTSDETTENPDA